ncbi:NAD-binding protein [Pseudidiomarina donghaiensis]|uniref:RCK N-terminal domain-containing protein n=1 Tax=Pseudidiomarina donghaiensis TaxID=519452 RepID=A0A432XGZ0_9GAMM|nr:NAD-binding protein [Pseudidiomarina donghaiensis]RUO48013.1 hypothetical protein CWE24_08495 [Pseudidiomarina donghaiensis]SFV22765.1 TrkA-N domain-containing protein [Pseudidiomarina donghaiensis]
MGQAEHKLTVNTLRLTLYASAAFAVLFGIGMYGFAAHGNNLLQGVYGTLKLLLVDAPDFVFEGNNWALMVAAFTLPLFPAAALLSLLGAAAGVQWQLLRVVVRPRRHVFLGAGKMAASVAKNLATKGQHSILAVEQNIEGQYAQTIAGYAGALVLQHDVNNSLLLRKLRLQHAETIYVFTGDDQRNLAVARKVIEQLSHFKKPPRLVINIEAHEVLNVVTEEALFRNYQRRAELLWFSAPQQKARELSKRYPMRLASTLQQPEPIHVAVLGQGADSEALVLQLAKQNALLTAQRLYVTWFGRSEHHYNQFLLNHPVLGATQAKPEFGGVTPNVQLHFVNTGSNGVSVEIVRSAIHQQQGLPLHVAYMMEPDDYCGITETVRLCQVTKALNVSTRMVTCIAGSVFESLTKVQNSVAHYGPALTQVCWFHALNDLFDSSEKYPGELSDIFGLLVHSAYKAIFTKPPLQARHEHLQPEFEQRLHQVEQAARDEWLMHLPEAFRASSRQSGDHIFIKLRELGFHLRRRVPDDAPGIAESVLANLNKAIEHHIDALLRLEHTRFANERLVDGWLFHASNDKSLKLNNTLIPFDALAPEEVLKDEVIIRVMPVLLRHPYVQQYFVLSEI